MVYLQFIRLLLYIYCLLIIRFQPIRESAKSNNIAIAIKPNVIPGVKLGAKGLIFATVRARVNSRWLPPRCCSDLRPFVVLRL